MVATVVPIQAPVGGWNARDAVAAMPQDHAIKLDNWWPQPGRVTLRLGYTSYATNLGSHVEMLAEFDSGATSKFIAGADGKIWDITTTGSGTELSSGYSSNRWQWIVFSGSMGLVNGVDAPITYDGTTVAAMTVSGSGLTPSDLIGIHGFKSRSYFWEDDSQDFWYSAVNALGGTLTRFPLSRVGTFGGKLICMGTWSRDAGDGMDDLAVFIMSSGEAIIYQGSDPGADFSLVGVYRIGSPLSVRALTKLGGDLVVVTRDGYILLSEAIGGGRVSKGGALSSQIDQAVTEASMSYADNWGWQAVFFPPANMMLFNVPVAENTTYQQHAFNTITGAPTRFRDIPSRCWGVYNDEIYFGGDGVVYKFWDGFSDAGSNIRGDAITSYNYLGSRKRLKHVTSIQPLIGSEGDLGLSTKVGVDFQVPSTTYNQSSYANSGSTWDVATWDVDEWTGGSSITQKWISGAGLGYAFALNLRIDSGAQPIDWYSTNWLVKPAGQI